MTPPYGGDCCAVGLLQTLLLVLPSFMGATKGGTFTGAGQSTPRDLSPHKGYPDLQAIAVQRCLYHGLTRLTARSTLFSCLVVRRRRVKSTPKGRPLIMRYMGPKSCRTAASADHTG